MQIIAFNNKKNQHFLCDLDIDPLNDNVGDIYRQVCAASKEDYFSLLVCIEDGEEVAVFVVDEDFDPDIEDDGEDAADPDDIDDDDLHDDDEDEDD